MFHQNVINFSVAFSLQQVIFPIKCHSVTKLCPTLCKWVAISFSFSISFSAISLQPTPVFLPGESQGRGSLVGGCLWGCTESDMTEVTQQQQQQQTAAHQASLSFTISQSLLKLMSIESVMPSNHLILYHPLLLLPSVFPRIKVFSNESALRIR